MAITLHDPALTPNKIMPVVNNTGSVLDVIGHIDGSPGIAQLLTVGSMVTFQSDGTTWWIIGLYLRPHIETQIPIGLPLAIATSPSITDLGIDLTFPVRGIWHVTGGFNFEHTIGNNATVSGELIFRIDGGANLEVIPWGFGRLSTFADIHVPVAVQIDNEDGSLVGETVSVFASNTGDGSLVLNSPAAIENSGPY